MFRKTFGILLLLFIVPVIFADDDNIKLTLQMPEVMLSPGMICKLDLNFRNNGPGYHNCFLFVALTVGTDEYWFYPGWCRFPDDIDWEELDLLPSGESSKSIIPAFEWPDGAGEFWGAMFLAALVHDGEMIGNLAELTFGWTEESIPSNFAYIPAGSFDMGSPDMELCRYSNEGPLHPVTITHEFYMQKTEVTQQRWIDVFESNPSDHDDCLNCPVENVTWYDCCVYCNRLSVAEGLTPCYYSDESFVTVFDGTPPVQEGPVYWRQDADGYRLPTAAEWEYACRAGTSTAYNSGENNTGCYEDPKLDPLGWYKYNSDTGDGRERETHPVGLKQPNTWGLYDMHGNIWEWCWDYFDENYYSVSPSSDPTGPSDGSWHSLRGGNWLFDARNCRSALRGSGDPGHRFSYVGFRIVLPMK